MVQIKCTIIDSHMGGSQFSWVILNLRGVILKVERGILFSQFLYFGEVISIQLLSGCTINVPEILNIFFFEK